MNAHDAGTPKLDAGERSGREPSLRDLPSVRLQGSDRAILGCLDLVSPRLIEGWAFDPSHPDQPVSLVAYVGDEIIWTGLADQLREDLRSAGLASGRCAFCVDFSSRSSTSKASHLQVSVRLAEHDVDLPGSPAIVVPRDILFRSPNIVGNFESVNAANIRGWAIDYSAPNVPVNIDIMDSNRLLVRATANRYRADLEYNNIGDGHHAFMLPTPSSLLDGARHIVRAVVSNTTQQLSHSPVVVQFDVDLAQQITSEFQNTIHNSTQALLNLEKIAEQTAISLSVRDRKETETYREWRRTFGDPTPAQRAALVERAEALTSRPTFSVIMATHNTPGEMLEAAIGSVVAQIYPHWELCIADDGSGEATRDAVARLADRDVRIKTVFRPERGGISAATNSAMALATGEYVAFLDHDDLLTEDALLQFAFACAHGRPALLYSDEDKIDSGGHFFQPHFKPDFNYSLLLSYNYLCHFVAVRRSVAEQAGPFSPAYDGAQDHEFLLRCCESVKPADIRHVPLVLYHWRSHAESTAHTLDAKSHAIQAGVKAVSDHLRRCDAKATVSRSAAGAYRVAWALPAQPPLVSIIIPTRDQHEVLAKCIASLVTLTRYPALEIVVIDNQTTQPESLRLLDRIVEDERIRVVHYDHPFNFSAICNFGARQARGDLLLMFNNDVEALEPEWLEEMVGQCLRPDVGAVGARLLYPDGRVQHAGVILGVGGVAGHSHKYLRHDETGYMNRPNVVQELSACTAACLLLRREVFEQVDGFDEANLAVSFNDVDLCLRIVEAGRRIVYTPYATLRHHESVSRGADDADIVKLKIAHRERDYMIAKWGDLLQSDPAYSPNLTLTQEDFSVNPSRGTPRVRQASGDFSMR